MQTPKPQLDGIRVLDLSRLLPGPFLTLALADLGADVVKVEDPRVGDYMRQLFAGKGGMSGRFLGMNRDKRSVALDLKSDAGREAFLKMAETVDVVVESFRPGVMDRLGVGYEQLRERNEKIILCSISGYGQDGPYRTRAGHDLNYIGLAGVLAMGGSRNGAPMLPGIQIADLAGGALWGLSGVLGALVGRERNGTGAHLDISMAEGALALLAAELTNVSTGTEVPTRSTGTLNGALACYSVYETSDGKYISVGALEPKFFIAFNNAIGRTPDMTELLAPAEKQDEARKEIQGIFLTKTRDEWSAIFAEHDCCCEVVLELDELANHPLHVERNQFVSQDGGPHGTIEHVRLPIGEPRMNRIAPALGEHTAEVLAEYGLSDDDIAALTK
jgi:crotonobetainyl-CoA:carnitine CoA-transferase CaiB-like acyl-CoA transferase